MVEKIAKRQPLRVVFRDSGFANSPAKINVTEIFKLLAPYQSKSDLTGGAEMKNNEIHEANQSDFLKNVSDVLLQAQKNAKTAVNLSMVYAYYEIGRMIVEEEQHGENRATYGKKLLKELSTYLTGMFGKGYSAENLKLMRRFYSIYSHGSNWGNSVYPIRESSGDQYRKKILPELVCII